MNTNKTNDKEQEEKVLGEVEKTESGLIRTYLVFLDLPVHIEYKVGNFPLLNVGRIIEFDLSLRHLKDPKRIKRVQGPYIIECQRLKYVSDGKPSARGLSQYLEIKPFKIT